jgi:arylformamidase
MNDKRVVFDFEIAFTNGGGIQGQDFRLDVDGETIDDKALADYIIQDMQLLMVGEVKILNKYYIEEKHKWKPISASSDEQLIDLSHTVFDGLVTYKGLPAPIICDYLSRERSKEFYEAGTEFQIGKIEMVTNTGTYLDCPFHRFGHGKDLSQIALEQCAELDAITINAKDATAIGKEYFVGKEIRNKAVLVYTNWARHWNTADYFEGHPYLTEDAAIWLASTATTLIILPVKQDPYIPLCLALRS